MRSENASIVGKMMVMEGAILLVPLLVLPFFRQEIIYASDFLIPSIFSMVIGALLHFKGNIKSSVNGSRIVVFSWMYGFFLAAMPFYIYGNVSFVQAFFEAVSGFTTTGLSVLDVTKTPQIFLFYRSLIQFVGGVGFVITMLTFIQSKHAVDLYEAEGHPDRLMPNIGKTAKVIVFMYSFFLVVGTVVYTIFKMPVFDSIMNTMCALSTGGFSNRLESIGYYHSFSIEIITIVLMLIGTTNFSILLLLFKGNFKGFFKSSEMRFLGAVSLISIPTMGLFLAKSGTSVMESLRLALFNAFSAISTTGYSTCGYSDWPDTAIAVMIILMIIGGGIGSTAGGIKLGRVCILLKSLQKNVKRKLIPQRRVILSYYHKGTENEILTEDKIEEATTYAHAYILIFIVGSIALTYFSNASFLEASFEFASALGTVGLSIGITNMDTSVVCLIIEIIGMIFGRLEIFVIFKAILTNPRGSREILS